MSSEPLDVMVYSGQHTEALFLKSLLEGSGIAAKLLNLRHPETMTSVCTWLNPT
jgi:hypothetical protein